MFCVWGLGYATTKEIANKLGTSDLVAHKAISSLARAGILSRTKIEDVWTYSINPDWVKSNPDITYMLEAVDEARAKGSDPFEDITQP
jgi:predicted transcriptional regulator